MLERTNDAASSGDFVLDHFFNLTEVGAFHIVDLFAGLCLATLLTLGLVQTYRSTHRGATYSVAFLQALFILSVCTTVIMVVIGSNIARAFSLVGALSIVRFRTAIKDPRDVGFVFAALAGTRLDRRRSGKIAIGAIALVASLAMTGIYHAGYSDFRSEKMRKPLAGDAIWSVPTLITLNPIGSPIAHVGLHTSAVLHSYETDTFLPPHR